MDQLKIDRLDAALADLRREVLRAMEKHAPMHSPHEGHSVIREELDELWDHVKADTGRTAEARTEAMQVAAMGLRYVVDLTRSAPPQFPDDPQFDVAVMANRRAL